MYIHNFIFKILFRVDYLFLTRSYIRSSNRSGETSVNHHVELKIIIFLDFILLAFRDLGFSKERACCLGSDFQQCQRMGGPPSVSCVGISLKGCFIHAKVELNRVLSRDCRGQYISAWRPWLG
jgi:hypothetical protein